MLLLLAQITACQPPLEPFWTCLPPAQYVPDKRRCEDPPADSGRMPGGIPFAFLCGYSAGDLRILRPQE